MNDLIKGFSKLVLRQSLVKPPIFISACIKNPLTTNTFVKRFSSLDGNSGNDSWLKWQQSLINSSDEGPKKKSRGGKTLRKRATQNLVSSVTPEASSQERLLDAGQGQFPPLRFSDSETERLLAEAYAGLPKKTGKRGTRALKRQKVKYHFIRKAHKIKKQEKIQHHFAVMAKRSKKVQDIQKMKEISEKDRAADEEYKKRVLEEFRARTASV